MAEHEPFGWSIKLEKAGQRYNSAQIDYAIAKRKFDKGQGSESDVEKARELLIQANERRIKIFESTYPKLTAHGQEGLIDSIAPTYKDGQKLHEDSSLIETILREQLQKYLETGRGPELFNDKF